MGVVGPEEQLCACNKECKEFHKLVELKDTGLVVYCHNTRTDDVLQGELVDTTVNTISQDVFILHNTKDEEITPADLIPQLEKNDISCPRCRKIFEHAQELLQKVTSIDRNNVMGICDHCRKKALSKKPCHGCEEIVKKFITSKGEQKEDTKKYIKIWLSKMGNLLKDAMTPDKLKPAESRTLSEQQIDRLLQSSPKYRREPEVKQMFSETHKSATNLHADTTDVHFRVGKSVAFIQPTEPRTKTIIADTPYEVAKTPDAFLAGSDATLVEPYAGVKEGPKTSLNDSQDLRGKKEVYEFYDDTLMDPKEAMKKRHDLSLRHMMRLEKGVVTPDSVSHKPEIYEIPKIAPWEKIPATPKESEIGMKAPIQSEQQLQSSQKDFRQKKDHILDESVLDVKKGSKSIKESESEYRDLRAVGSKSTKYETSRTSSKDLRKSQRKRKHASEIFNESVITMKGPTKRKMDTAEFERKDRDPYFDQYEHEIKKTIYDSEEIPKKVKKREDRYLADGEIKLQRSIAKFSHEREKLGQREIKTKIRGKKALGPKETTENILKQQFSYFFPKSKAKESKKLDARSSQLIKNTQERLRQQTEEQKKRREEELIIKQQEDEKKKIAREERKKQTQDNRRLLEQRLFAEEPKEMLASEEDKKRGEGKIPVKGKVDTDQHDKLTNDKGISETVSKLEVKSKIIKDSEATKGLKLETEPKDKSYRQIEGKRGKKDDMKSDQRDETGGMLQKASKDYRSKSEERDKAYEAPEKAKGEIKRKSEPKDKNDDVTKKLKKSMDKKGETKYRDEVTDKSKKGIKESLELKTKDIETTGKSKKGLKEGETKYKDDEGAAKDRKDQKGKLEPKDKDDQIAMEKIKKGLKEKRESRGKDDLITEKAKRDLKDQRETRDKDDKLTEKGKKGLKELHESKDKDDKVTEKGKRGLKEIHESKDKDEKVTEKGKRGLKEIHESKGKDGEVTGKGKKDIKEKPERKDKVDEIKEKGKKDLSEQSDKIYKDAEKQKQLKSEIKDTEKETLQAKEKAKREREEILQKDQDKERLKLVAQLKKEKEVAAKGKELESSKGKAELEKEKETSAKKAPLNKKEETFGKMKLISELEEPQVELKKQQLAKEKEEPNKKQKLSKEEEKETSKKKQGKGPKEESLDNVKKSKEDKAKVSEAPKKPPFTGMDEAQFRKLQAELMKQKEENLKKKKLLEVEEQKAKELANKREQEERQRILKIGKEAKAEVKPEPEEPQKQPEKKEEEEKKPTTKELQIRDIKLRNMSADDLILRLVKLRQTPTGERPRPCDIAPALIKAHKCHHVKSGQSSTLCALCCDSELEIDVESYDNKMNFTPGLADVIIGEKILKIKPSRLEKTEESEVVPMLFKSAFEVELQPSQVIIPVIQQEPEPVKKNILAALLAKKDSAGVETEPAKGIIRYALSDRTFIDKGWTMLPTEKVVRKMNVYRMRPAHPEFDWFEHNKNKRLMTYDTGEKLAEFDDNGRGRWYYRSGRLALDYYDAEETNAQQRFVIYSSGEPDERGRTHPITILATFDYLGNGIVFDHAGKIRLKYNQTEGVVLDRGIGPVSHWKWHTLNDPPVLQQVMIDTQMAHKDPAIIKLGTAADSKTRPDNEEMLAIEFDNFIKEKSKKLSQKFKPFQIKMKALKINEHFSLKVLDQATIYLIFRDGSTNLKLNIGMILDHQEIVDTDTAEVGEVSNNLERFPAKTDSLAGLQRSVAYAQRYERQRTERERRLRRPEPCASVDQLTAAASPPLRPPMRTMSTGSITSTGYCNCRKPPNSLYYNTRLL